MAHLYPLTRLSDRQLLDALTSLVRDKRAHDATLLAHIAEVDRRRLYEAEGYSSMFTYCCEVLHLSEGGAYNRIAVARAARRFPLVFDMLANGAVHHAGLRLLAPRLTQDNQRALLVAATHKSKRQIERLLAERFPQPDVPTTVRALPRRSAKVGVSMERPSSLFCSAPARAPTSSPAPPVVAPLSAKRYRVEFTAGQSLKDKLDRAKALLRHRSPHIDEAEVVDRALDALLAQLDKQKFAATDKPRACKDSSSRYIPADVRRAVHERDGGRCTFVSVGGKRCDESAFLELDHIVPVAKGGPSTVDNLRERCRAHNQYAARLELGRSYAREARVHYATRPGTSCDGVGRIGSDSSMGELRGRGTGRLGLVDGRVARVGSDSSRDESRGPCAGRLELVPGLAALTARGCYQRAGLDLHIVPLPPRSLPGTSSSTSGEIARPVNSPRSPELSYTA